MIEVHDVFLRFWLWAVIGATSAAALASSPLLQADAEGESPSQLTSTTITSQKDAARLQALEGVTLQWIDWAKRGRATVTINQEGLWRLNAKQTDEYGLLQVSGAIHEIGQDYFILSGRIIIMDTPDRDRICDRSKKWRFEVTQNRSYYRLREFEWCDYLTDYIDIYFKPSLRN